MCTCNNLSNTNIIIKTEIMKKICKYHKKPGQEFHMSDIAPKGMCFEAFYAAYPSALALLYNAKMTTSSCIFSKNISRREVVFQCPSEKNKIVFHMQKKEKLPLIIKQFKHFAEKCFAYFFPPIDKVQWEYDISIEVINVCGQCPQGHKRGDTYYFNTSNPAILCPASFYTIYPFLRLFYKDEKIPWCNNNDILIHCPDHEGIIYKLVKRDKKNG